MVLQIGSCDCTGMILQGEYQVQRNQEYEEWKDGWGHLHRVAILDRINGEVTLKPKTQEAYESLVHAIRDERDKDDNTYVVTAFVNNVNALVTFRAFIDGEYVMSSSVNRKWWDEIVLTIEEK